MRHFGKVTKSTIQADGTLMDAAEKIFRGTIDFVRGSADSVGAETEQVLLLGDDVVNKTIPVILCAEENVQGSHGAAIGELDEETLFYFGARGMGKYTGRKYDSAGETGSKNPEDRRCGHRTESKNTACGGA